LRSWRLVLLRWLAHWSWYWGWFLLSLYWGRCDGFLLSCWGIL
jgi:hypothetical protein